MNRPATYLALGLAALAGLCLPFQMYDIARTLAGFATLIVVFRWVYDGLVRAGVRIPDVNEPWRMP